MTLKQYFITQKELEKKEIPNGREHFKAILLKLENFQPEKLKTSPYKKHFYIITSIVSATLLAIMFFSGNTNYGTEQYQPQNLEQKNAILKAIDDSNSFEEEDYEEI